MPLRDDEKEEVRAIIKEELAKGKVNIKTNVIATDEDRLALVKWINNYVESKGGRLVASAVPTKGGKKK